MLRKLIVLAITSGLAAGLYRKYLNQREQDAAVASSAPVATRRRRAGTQGDPA
ncbi:hypothetical protein [Polaromonas sp. SM01]|uniref:hypothetical protein n=1 Tax=Polaromonas sp. SM01 TaxID=3085630 RepID=UPI002980EDCC|nr:hypothetical protein [Polaromonas sp. SM01]MDW5442662.1 hypothetical protein [Polaromonas sp. SM01]